jgi:hypothetical protein
MGFFSDLGNGIASIVKAPFEGVGALARGVGDGIGSILHGSANAPQSAPQYAGQRAQQMQGQDPMMAMHMLMLQTAMATNMMLAQAMYPPCLCRMM